MDKFKSISNLIVIIKTSINNLLNNRKKNQLKAKQFKYPSKKELRYANSICPKFQNFGFKHRSGIFSVLDGKPFEEAKRDDNLFWWDLTLTNRFGSLRRAYFNSITHFRRGFKEDYFQCSNNEVVNRILFDNYAEIFYYFFFASVDVIAQILNLYYSLSALDHKVKFDNIFISKIPDSKAKNILCKFFEETKTERNYRNSFAHRYPSNHPDYRIKIVIEDGKSVLHGGTGKYVSTDQVIKSINSSLESLSILMKDLRQFIQVN